MVEPVVAQSVVLTTSLATLYTVPANRRAQIPPLAFYNSSGSDIVVTVEYQNNGEADALLKNQLVLTVPAGQIEMTPFTKHLNAGGLVRAKAATGAVVNAFTEPIERVV